jgi:hypothetical protein
MVEQLERRGEPIELIAFPFITDLDEVLMIDPVGTWGTHVRHPTIGGVEITIDGSRRGTGSSCPPLVVSAPWERPTRSVRAWRSNSALRSLIDLGVLASGPVRDLVDPRRDVAVHAPTSTRTHGRNVDPGAQVLPATREVDDEWGPQHGWPVRVRAGGTPHVIRTPLVERPAAHVLPLHRRSARLDPEVPTASRGVERVMWKALSVASPSVLPTIGLAVLLGWAATIVVFYFVVR